MPFYKKEKTNRRGTTFGRKGRFCEAVASEFNTLAALRLPRLLNLGLAAAKARREAEGLHGLGG